MYAHPAPLPLLAPRSEQDVAEATTIPREVVMAAEAIVASERKRSHCLRLCQPHIDPHAAPPVCAGLALAPISNAAAARAEVEAEPLVAPRIQRGRARDLDTLVLVVVRPERAVAAADGAVAGGGGLRHAAEAPAHRAAVTDTFDPDGFLVHGGLPPLQRHYSRSTSCGRFTRGARR